MTERPTLAVGLMSGTSLDGVDAALVRLEGPTHASLLDFVTRPYSDAERSEIRAAFNGATPQTLARLHVRVADWAAEAIQTLLVQGKARASDLSLIAFPGQTIWHEPPLVSCSWGSPPFWPSDLACRW